MLELEERRLKNLKPRKEEKELPNSRKNIIKLFKSGTLNLRQNMLLNMNQLKLNQRKKKRKLLLKEVKLPQLKPQTKVKLIQKPLPKLPQLKKPQRKLKLQRKKNQRNQPQLLLPKQERSENLEEQYKQIFTFVVVVYLFMDCSILILSCNVSASVEQS